MSEIWERTIQEWYNNSRTSNLEYLDLTTTTRVSTNQLANNLAVVYDRTSLSTRVHLKNFKLILERCRALEIEVSQLKTALQNLIAVYTEHTPLTKQEVYDLIARISEQPKLMEEEALKITEELNKKLERVESLLHKLEKWAAS